MPAGAVYYVFPTPRTGVKTSDSGSTDRPSPMLRRAQRLILQQKLQAVRDLQRQMFESMTDEERQQMPAGYLAHGRTAAGRVRRAPPDGFGGPPPP